MGSINMYHLILKDYTPNDWDNLFFSEATLWSRKSPDVETQCGCVLVKNKTSIATGFNGFMRDINDSVFPNTRPDKYPFMIHAEANAIYNAAREGQSTIGASAYVTAAPCRDCLQMLWQCGISKIYFSDISSPKNAIWGDQYDMVLDQINGRMQMFFVPHTKLSDYALIESAKKIRKNSK